MVLAVCAKDVKFYTWPNIEFLGAYEVPPECMSVKHISWCCDGKNILVVKSKGEPLIVRAPTKTGNLKVVTQKCANLNNVSTGAFSRNDGSLLTLGMESGEVCKVDLENRDIIRYKRLPSGIQNLDFSRNDQNVLAGCFDGNIYLYDVKGRPIASFMVPNCYTLSTTLLSNYSDLLAGASKEGTLAVWDADSTDLIFATKEHTARITDLAFLENSVTSVSIDGFLCQFDLRSHSLISRSNLDGALSSLAYFPGTFDLAVGTYNQLRSYDLRNLSTPVRTLLINNGGHIKEIAACPMGVKDIYQPKEKCATGENISASGDFSIVSNLLSEDTSMMSDGYYEIYHQESKKEYLQQPCTAETSQKNEKFYKTSDVKELEKFVGEYMKYMTAQYTEKMAQSFYGLRINTSKQFICMGEKMDQSWNNFIAYLRFAGTSDRGSSSDSKNGSDKEVEKQK